MDVGAALSALERAGTEQNRKIYAKHGYPEPMFGVSFAMLRQLAKDIGQDQGLAEDLWVSGNADARNLAAMIADPDALTRAIADDWVATAGCHTIIDEVAKVVARSPLALPCMAEWIGSDDEWIGRAGWSVMSALATWHPEVPDASFTPYIAVIERRIGGAQNRTREAMNSALIAIGGRSAALAEPAIAAARRIGPVEIDHGQTACETPDAVAYIQKMRARADGGKVSSTSERVTSRMKVLSSEETTRPMPVSKRAETVREAAARPRRAAPAKKAAAVKTPGAANKLALAKTLAAKQPAAKAAAKKPVAKKPAAAKKAAAKKPAAKKPAAKKPAAKKRGR
ncbi:MAG: DNA alkylation repair protein [Deltaproteobacteria bacterium]|nr:DNA alkylation repair protein [Deltaproteobacteria bacterium]